MGSNLGGHKTGAKAVRSEKTRPVLGMKEGNRLGSSFDSAAGAFASFGVDGAGACSFSIACVAGQRCAACLGSKLGPARDAAEPARERRLPGARPTRRRRPLGALKRNGERETAARATVKGSPCCWRSPHQRPLTALRARGQPRPNASVQNLSHTTSRATASA